MLIDFPFVVRRAALGASASAPVAERPRAERPFVLADAAESPAETFSEAADAYGLGARAVDAALGALPLAALLVDGEGRVVWANEAARRLRAACGREALAAARRLAVRALLDERAVHEELSHRAGSDRAPRWLAVAATPMLDGVGVPLALLTVADATERVRGAQWAPIVESLMNL